MVTRALALAVLAACSADIIVVVPLIHGPDPKLNPLTYPWVPELERIQLLLVAPDGEIKLARTFLRGEPPELTDVPYGEGFVLHMDGRLSNGNQHAYGQTCPFSIRHDEAPPQLHLWFSAVGWGDVEVEIPHSDRVNGAGLTHRDGSALFVGGLTMAGEAVTAIDRFDPVANTFTVVTDSEPRRGGAVTALNDLVVIAGGLDPGTLEPMGVYEVIDIDEPDLHVFPANASAMGAGSPRYVALDNVGDPTIGPPDIIFGFGGTDPADVLLPTISKIVQIGSGEVTPDVSGARLFETRKDHSATAIDDGSTRVLIAGGVDAADSIISSAELFTALGESITMVGGPSPTMTVPRRDHVALALPDGSVVFLGGRDAAGDLITTTEQFTLDRGFIPDLRPLPNNAPIGFSVTRLADGRFLVAGGYDKPPDLTSAPQRITGTFTVGVDRIGGGYNLVADAFMRIARADHQAALLCDGTVLVVGGTDSPGQPAERYSPSTQSRRPPDAPEP